MPKKKTVRVYTHNYISIDRSFETTWVDVWVSFDLGRRKQRYCFTFDARDNYESNLIDRQNELAKCQPDHLEHQELVDFLTRTETSFRVYDADTGETRTESFKREVKPNALEEYQSDLNQGIKRLEETLSQLTADVNFVVAHEYEDDPNIPDILVNATSITHDLVEKGIAWYLKTKVGIKAPLKFKWDKPKIFVYSA